MHKMVELREMLCKELDGITDMGEISNATLDAINKLTHSIKSIDTILAMKGYDHKTETKSELKKNLQELYDNAKDDETRKWVTEWMKEIHN